MRSVPHSKTTQTLSDELSVNRDGELVSRDATGRRRIVEGFTTFLPYDKACTYAYELGTVDHIRAVGRLLKD